MLGTFGCDLAQGYLISPPIRSEEIAPWSKQFRRTWPALITDEKLALWGDLEADALRER